MYNIVDMYAHCEYSGDNINNKEKWGQLSPWPRPSVKD
jgi:hypothetical protein